MSFLKQIMNPTTEKSTTPINLKTRKRKSGNRKSGKRKTGKTGKTMELKKLIQTVMQGKKKPWVQL